MSLETGCRRVRAASRRGSPRARAAARGPVLALLLSCALLPLRAVDPPPASAGLSGALRRSGLPARADAVSLPLKSTFVGYTVEVRFDGRPLQLVLDTGASCTIIATDAARKLGLKPADATETGMSASGGVFTARRALVPRLGLGDGWTENEPVMVSDLIPGIDGLLGMATLADWDVRIDPQAGRLTLFPAGKAPPMEGETAIPLTCDVMSPVSAPSNPQAFRLLNLVVPVRVGDHRLMAIPDTGHGGICLLPAEFFQDREPALMRDAQPGRVTGITLSGDQVTRTVRLPEFTFGPDTLRGLKTDLVEAGPTRSGVPVGILGLNLLRHYVMTFRFAAGELRLKPLGTVQEITRASTAGINMGRFGKILSVEPGGPGDKAGLRAGDELLEIEGRPLESMTPAEFAAFKRQPPGSIVKVRYRRDGSPAVEARLVLVKE